MVAVRKKVVFKTASYDDLCSVEVDSTDVNFLPYNNLHGSCFTISCEVFDVCEVQNTEKDVLNLDHFTGKITLPYIKMCDVSSFCNYIVGFIIIYNNLS